MSGPFKPVPHVGAFLGGLWDIGLRASARRLEVTLGMPMGDLSDFLNVVGLPARLEIAETAWAEGRLAPVAIMPVRPPRHPQNEADAIAEAAVALVTRGLTEGTVRLTPALAEKLDGLHEAIADAPIVVPFELKV